MLTKSKFCYGPPLFFISTKVLTKSSIANQYCFLSEKGGHSSIADKIISHKQGIAFMYKHIIEWLSLCLSVSLFLRLSVSLPLCLFLTLFVSLILDNDDVDLENDHNFLILPVTHHNYFILLYRL